MTDKSARTVIAQALFDYGGGGGGADRELVDLFEGVCRDQTRAILIALQAGGFAVVPKDIDTGNIALIEAINGGGCQGWSGQIIDSHIADARRRWRRILSAMLLAASGPKGEEG